MFRSLRARSRLEDEENTMSRLRKLVVVALAAAVLWKVVYQKVARSQGTDGAAWRGRMSAVLRPRARRADRGGAALSADLDSGSVEFEWLVRTSDPGAVYEALAEAGIRVNRLDPAARERREMIVERLEAVGMHLDEEAGGGDTRAAVACYVGSTSPGRLATAFERARRAAHTGFIVDVSPSGPVLIDEHHAVGSGVLALIEPGQARLTHGESGRAFLRALRSAAERRAAAARMRWRDSGMEWTADMKCTVCGFVDSARSFDADDRDLAEREKETCPNCGEAEGLRVMNETLHPSI
jgi:hypothetical protein